MGLRRRGFAPDVINNIHEAYRIVYQKDLLLNERIELIRKTVPMSKEIEYILEFLQNSKRGVIPSLT